ncbi:MAG TPA: YfhO family protein [Geobacteraceae bacterium]|nr:YfhO family protein [Geobacteraceae bacterium]
MTERRKDMLWMTALLALLILFFAKILFTGKIVRAPDITNEFLWTIKGFKDLGFCDLFKVSLHPTWSMFINSGTSEGGGTLSMQFLFYRNLIFRLLPEPANIAWFMVLHMFFGAAGTFFYCRAIGAGRIASFLGGLIFALAPENASLINAGHVQKIATISFAPWAFYFFEKGFQKRRVIFFLATGFVLAFQFFNMHWQIAYYTCLGIGAYGLIRTVGIVLREKNAGKKSVFRLLGLNAVTALFFLSTVAISLIPLADWSKDTNRGVQSGANQGKGGLNADEAMSWSLPPEETATFVIPGFFGFSRQEGAYDGANIKSYYWGRMVFTQTSDYMGLLPWLLLPLPLLFRRDVYTWTALAAVTGGILFSMGKYTPFYWLLYSHFPGIDHFRVPKMMMFLPVLGLGVLAARGLDILMEEEMRQSVVFRRYLSALLALPALLTLLLAAEVIGKGFWLTTFYGMLAQPTRFEQGANLVMQRWNNLVGETGLAVITSILYGVAVYFLSSKRMAVKWLPLALLLLYCLDVGRVDAKFMLLQDVPEKAKGVKAPVMDYLAKDSVRYRTLPLDGSDPMQYASNDIPVMFTSNAVQQVRWQNFLDAFNLASSMPDMLNVRYLVYGAEQYARDKALMNGKYSPVPNLPDGPAVLLENRTVLPKGWLVPAAALITDPGQTLGILRDPRFDPRRVALVETPPPIPLADPNAPGTGNAGEVSITRYECNNISINTSSGRNSLLVLGEKYFRGWRATVDGKAAEIYPVNHILRGVYLTSGSHKVEFAFDPIPFKIGKWITLTSFVFFAAMLGREWLNRMRQ